MEQSIRGANGDVNAFNHASLAIGFAVLFDGLDGRVARWTNTSSDFGREFDSLADVITFGVAPALLAYLWGVQSVVPSAYPAVQQRLCPVQLCAFCGAWAAFRRRVRACVYRGWFLQPGVQQPGGTGEHGARECIFGSFPIVIGTLALNVS